MNQIDATFVDDLRSSGLDRSERRHLGTRRSLSHFGRYIGCHTDFHTCFQLASSIHPEFSREPLKAGIDPIFPPILSKLSHPSDKLSP